MDRTLSYPNATWLCHPDHGFFSFLRRGWLVNQFVECICITNDPSIIIILVIAMIMLALFMIQASYFYFTYSIVPVIFEIMQERKLKQHLKRYPYAQLVTSTTPSNYQMKEDDYGSGGGTDNDIYNRYNCNTNNDYTYCYTPLNLSSWSTSRKKTFRSSATPSTTSRRRSISKKQQGHYLLPKSKQLFQNAFTIPKKGDWISYTMNNLFYYGTVLCKQFIHCMVVLGIFVMNKGKLGLHSIQRRFVDIMGQIWYSHHNSTTTKSSASVADTPPSVVTGIPMETIVLVHQRQQRSSSNDLSMISKGGTPGSILKKRNANKRNSFDGSIDGSVDRSSNGSGFVVENSGNNKRSVLFSELEDGKIKTEKYYYHPHQTPDHRLDRSNNKNNNIPTIDPTYDRSTSNHATSTTTQLTKTDMSRISAMSSLNHVDSYMVRPKTNTQALANKENQSPRDEKSKLTNKMIGYRHHSLARRQLLKNLRSDLDYASIPISPQSKKRLDSGRTMEYNQQQYGHNKRPKLLIVAGANHHHGGKLRSSDYHPLLNRPIRNPVSKKRTRQEEEKEIWNILNYVPPKHDDKRIKQKQDATILSMTATVSASSATTPPFQPAFEFGSTPAKTPPPGPVHVATQSSIHNVNALYNNETDPDTATPVVSNQVVDPNNPPAASFQFGVIKSSNRNDNTDDNHEQQSFQLGNQVLVIDETTNAMASNLSAAVDQASNFQFGNSSSSMNKPIESKTNVAFGNSSFIPSSSTATSDVVTGGPTQTNTHSTNGFDAPTSNESSGPAPLFGTTTWNNMAGGITGNTPTVVANSTGASTAGTSDGYGSIPAAPSITFGGSTSSAASTALASNLISSTNVGPSFVATSTPAQFGMTVTSTAAGTPVFGQQTPVFGMTSPPLTSGTATPSFAVGSVIPQSRGNLAKSRMKAKQRRQR